MTLYKNVTRGADMYRYITGVSMIMGAGVGDNTYGSDTGTAMGVVKTYMSRTAWCKGNANCLYISVKMVTLK